MKGADGFFATTPLGSYSNILSTHMFHAKDVGVPNSAAVLKDWLVVIPARLASSRLPEKPLQDLAGKPLIIRVRENIAALEQQGAKILVATDSEKIKKTCENFGISCTLTSVDHQSGTDRAWEVASKHPQPFVLNVQGDEPFVNPHDLMRLMAALQRESAADLATLFVRQNHERDFHNPNVVKAIRAANGKALYFTRASAPYPRDHPKSGDFLQHVGVYAYRRDSLERFCAFGESALERRERLEQLRALENGMIIYLEEASSLSLGIDTKEDLEAARARYL